MLKDLTYEQMIEGLEKTFFSNIPDKESMKKVQFYQVLMMMLNAAKALQDRGLSRYLYPSDGTPKFAFMDLRNLTPAVVRAGVPNYVVNSFKLNRITDFAIVVHPDDPETGKLQPNYIFISINKKGFSYGESKASMVNLNAR